MKITEEICDGCGAKITGKVIATIDNKDLCQKCVHIRLRYSHIMRPIGQKCAHCKGTKSEDHEWTKCIHCNGTGYEPIRVTAINRPSDASGRGINDDRSPTIT